MKKPSSEPVPREQLSAWQRWELASFDRGPGDADGGAAARMQAELAAIRAQAAAAGREEGHAAGLAAAAAERAQLQALLAALATTADDHEQCVVDEMLDLALLLARQMVGKALAVRRELIVPVVAAALHQLPQSAQRIQIQLNPADIRIVESFLASSPGGPSCALIPDATIEPGGCRMETEQSSLDATTRTRWQRLLAGLGRCDDWLEST